jgi:hypothetical protein
MALKLHSSSKDSQSTVEYYLFQIFPLYILQVIGLQNKQGQF